jgi:imidazole glycerol phosphate synthase glutamine amidotransferase subunit
MADVLVIDYGMGNLRSLTNALRALGAQVQVSDDPRLIYTSERLILPGVGAFGRSMQELGSRDLLAPLNDAVRGGKPLLGICLGFQVLFGSSTEHGEHPGLGYVSGRIERFEGEGLIVPHMGWNRLVLERPHALLEGVASGAHVYFVHSYRPAEADADDVLARTDYGGWFVSAVARGNVAGLQFHPEKSGPVGLRLLSNFLTWEPS